MKKSKQDRITIIELIVGYTLSFLCLVYYFYSCFKAYIKYSCKGYPKD